MSDISAETYEFEQECRTVRACNAVRNYRLTPDKVLQDGRRMHLLGVGKVTEEELREVALNMVVAHKVAALDRACKTPWFEFCF